MSTAKTIRSAFTALGLALILNSSSVAEEKPSGEAPESIPENSSPSEEEQTLPPCPVRQLPPGYRDLLYRFDPNNMPSHLRDKTIEISDDADISDQRSTQSPDLQNTNLVLSRQTDCVYVI